MSRAYPPQNLPFPTTPLTDGPVQLSPVPLSQDQVLRRDSLPQLQEIKQFEPMRLPGPRSEGCHF